MNYIHRLQADVAALKADKAEALEQVQWMLEYLNSPKFAQDERVQRNDLLPALFQIRLTLGD